MKIRFLLFTFLTTLSSFHLSGQKAFELKTNPFLLLFPEAGLPISAEFIIKPDIGIGLDAYLGEYGGLLYLTGRYYFNENYGADRLFVGPFLGSLLVSDEGALAFGFLTGYKVMSKKRVGLDLGVGLGRATNIGVLPYAVLNISYRFKSKSGSN
jgi:hypothetical protein